MSSAPFTGYKSATKDRLLLDQRGVNGQEAQLLEGPSARLPAGWQFTDLQLGPGECARVSASDISFSLLRLLGSFASEGRSQPCWATSSLAEFPGTGFHGNASGAPFLARWRPSPAISGKEPQGAPRTRRRRYKIIWQLIWALAQGDHCAVDFAQQAHWNLLRTAEASSTTWDDIRRSRFPAFSFD